MAPPAVNCFGGELCGVMIGTDAYPPPVPRYIIDSVWNGLAQFLVEKVMHPHCFRFALRLPFPTPVLKVPNQFFFLRILFFVSTETTGCPRC